MTEIFAVPLSPFGHFAHLYLPGYQPGKKARSSGVHHPLCGSQNAPIDIDQVVPLALALQNWSNPDKATELRGPMAWEWCRSCVGHAAAVAGLQRSVLHQVTAATYRPVGELT